MGTHSTWTSCSPALSSPASQGTATARAGELGHTQPKTWASPTCTPSTEYRFPPHQTSLLSPCQSNRLRTEPVLQRQVSWQPKAVSAGFVPRCKEALDRSFIVQPNVAETRPGAVQSKNKKVTGTPHIIYISACNGSIGNKGIQALERECLAVK